MPLARVTDSLRACGNQRRTRSITDALAAAAPDLNRDELAETTRVLERLYDLLVQKPKPRASGIAE